MCELARQAALFSAEGDFLKKLLKFIFIYVILIKAYLFL